MRNDDGRFALVTGTGAGDWGSCGASAARTRLDGLRRSRGSACSNGFAERGLLVPRQAPARDTVIVSRDRRPPPSPSGGSGARDRRLQHSSISTDIVRNAPPCGRRCARARIDLASAHVHCRSRGGAACLHHVRPADRFQPGARTVREIGAIGRAGVDDPHDWPDVGFVDADAAATRQQTIREQSKNAHPAPPDKGPARV
jgi:hypothetical protein